MDTKIFQSAFNNNKENDLRYSMPPKESISLKKTPGIERVYLGDKVLFGGTV